MSNNRETTCGALLEDLKPFDSAKERNIRRPFEKDVQVTGMPAAADNKTEILIVQRPGTSSERIVRVRRADIARVVVLPAFMDPLTNELLPQVKVSIKAGTIFSVTRTIKAGEPEFSVRATCATSPYVELPLEPIPAPPAYVSLPGC